MKLMIGLVIGTIFLAGCASSEPDQANGQDTFHRYIERVSDGRIGVTMFEKTDGQRREFGGVDFYTLEYKAEVQYLEECWSPQTTFLLGPYSRFSTRSLEEGAPQRRWMGPLSQWKRRSVGETYTIDKGSMTFEKKVVG